VAVTVPTHASTLLPPASARCGFGALAGLLDDVALVEHANGPHPDTSSGHCVDDAGRALALASTAGDDPTARVVAERCVAFLEAMHLGGGRFLLRDRSVPGDPDTSDDGSGRALHGLGVALATAPWRPVRERARRTFVAAAAFDSGHLRAAGHAVVGAAAALGAPHPPREAHDMLERLVPRLRPPAGRPWPEERLTYGNGLVCEALLAGATVRGDDADRRVALAMLDWLASVEIREGWLSPTPVGGWAPGEPRPGFDQQPIEAGTLASAAALAHATTGDDRWRRVATTSLGWFTGHNDVGELMWDPGTGRSFDGLGRSGVNRNQGAESTLALIGARAALHRVTHPAVGSFA
jgi:hypothetical protein